MDFDCCVKSTRNRDGIRITLCCLSGKCCNQLRFIARILGLVKSRRLLLIIYQLHGIWNTCTNLLCLVANYFSDSSESWFPKWLSHPAEKIRCKCLILQYLGLYTYICIVGKKHLN